VEDGEEVAVVLVEDAAVLEAGAAVAVMPIMKLLVTDAVLADLLPVALLVVIVAILTDRRVVIIVAILTDMVMIVETPTEARLDHIDRRISI